MQTNKNIVSLQLEWTDYLNYFHYLYYLWIICRLFALFVDYLWIIWDIVCGLFALLHYLWIFCKFFGVYCILFVGCCRLFSDYCKPANQGSRVCAWIGKCLPKLWPQHIWPQTCWKGGPGSKGLKDGTLGGVWIQPMMVLLCCTRQLQT